MFVYDESFKPSLIFVVKLGNQPKLYDSYRKSFLQSNQLYANATKNMVKLARVFVIVQHFHPCLIFVNKSNNNVRHTANAFKLFLIFHCLVSNIS